MGIFITLEGIEGSGKSTQMELLKGYLEGRGLHVTALREPGGTRLGEQIRAILLNDADGRRIEPRAELYLYEACRAELVEEVIRPALDRGRTVICDRYVDSTVAYQGYGRGLDIDSVMAINRSAIAGVMPDITIVLDMEPAEGIERALTRIEGLKKEGGSAEDRFEKEALDFHSRVREGYLKIAEAEAERVRVVDGNGEIGSIHKAICDIIGAVIS